MIPEGHFVLPGDSDLQRLDGMDSDFGSHEPLPH